MTVVSRVDQSGVKRGANLLVALEGCLSARTAAPCLQQRLFRSETTAQAPLDADFWPGVGMRRLASRERPVLNPAYRCARYTEGRAALTSEVGCSDLSDVTVKQHCYLETALP